MNEVSSTTADPSAGNNSATDTTTVFECAANGDCKTATAAFCDTTTHGCTGCSGDNGTAGAFPCPSMNPWCAPTGTCGKCMNNGDCVGHPGGKTCDSRTRQASS